VEKWEMVTFWKPRHSRLLMMKRKELEVIAAMSMSNVTRDRYSLVIATSQWQRGLYG
jgi:hypothetical protein